MANEFYIPLQYPTYQYAQPYQPLQGALEAYSAGLAIRQQKQQAEMQKQQMAMQKQQMAMQQERLTMEQKREERQARSAELEDTIRRMDLEPKQELQGMFQAFQQTLQQNQGLPPEQQYKLAWSVASQAKYPQTREAARKMIMADIADKYATPELQAQAENLIFGTNLTPEQIQARDAKLVTSAAGTMLVSPTGKILQQQISEPEEYRRRMEEQKMKADERHRRAMEARAGGGGSGTAGSEREIGNAKQALLRIASAEQKLNRRELFAKTLIAQGDISGFGDVASESEINKFLNASGEAKKLQGEMILKGEVAPGRKNLDLSKKRWDSNFAAPVKSEAWRRNPDLAPVEPAAPATEPQQGQAPSSPHAAAKAALLAPAAGPTDETARLQAIASSPVDSPERRAARIRLAELAQQSGQFRYAPPAMPARQQLTTPQPIGWGTKY